MPKFTAAKIELEISSKKYKNVKIVNFQVQEI